MDGVFEVQRLELDRLVAIRHATVASPAGLILPCAVSSSTLSRLICDHLLRGPRGVNRCSQNRSSYAPFWPSIQP